MIRLDERIASWAKTEKFDGDGVRDPSEPGYGDVTVRLRTCEGALLSTTQSFADGRFWFTDLVAGRYRLEFEPPIGTELSPAEQGTSRGSDSNPDPASGLTTCLRMTDGQVRAGIDAGIIQL